MARESEKNTKNDVSTYEKAGLGAIACDLHVIPMG